MLQSFRSRLVISNLVITLVGLLVVVVVFTQLLSGRAEAVKISDRQQQAHQLAVQIQHLYRQHVTSPSALNEMLSVASHVLGVRVLVVSPDGVPYNPKGTTPKGSGGYRIDKKALRHAQATVKALSRNSNLYTFQSPIRGTRQRNGGAVLLVARVTDVRPSFASLQGVFLVVFGTALLVWLAIGLYFTYSISRPLHRITAATARMAWGDYDARVETRGHGEIGLLASSFNDMASQVQRSNRVLKDFVANVSHDLRTPLTLIAGFSQALVDGTAGPDEVEESAGMIHDESLKMQHMVDDLLQLTRLESGLLQFRRAAEDPRQLVQEVLDRVMRSHPDEEIAQLRNQVNADAPRIEIDREQIERALRNLIENALRFTPASGSVTVRSTRIGRGWVEFSVADTGSGIPRQDIPRVFERFYRSDRSRERGHGHSGLGLAIVREIVEGHGGQIRVESQEGRGTVFSFTVPQMPIEPAPRDEIPPATPARHPVPR